MIIGLISLFLNTQNLLIVFKSNNSFDIKHEPIIYKMIQSDKQKFSIKNIRQYINLDELMFDIVVLIVLMIFDFMISSSGKSLFIIMLGYDGLILFGIIQFLLAFQAGILFHKFRKNINSSIIRLLVYISLVLLISSLLITGVLLPPLEQFEEFKYVSGGIAGIALLLAGFLAGNYSLKKSPDKVAKTVGRIFFIAITLGASLFTVFLLFFEMRLNTEHAPMILKYYALIIVSAFVLLFLLPVPIARFFSNSSSVIKLIGKIIFTALLALSVMYWQTIIVGYNTGGELKLITILRLLLSGIIPFRILLATAPPQKKINLAIAFIVIIINILSFR